MELSTGFVGWRRSLAFVWLKRVLLFSLVERWLGTLGAATFVGRFIRSTPGRLDDGRSDFAFDRTSWLSNSSARRGARYLMMHDLIAKRALLGRTRAQVVGLLGPMRRLPWSAYEAGYELAPRDDLSQDEVAWLVLHFDADRVAKCEIRSIGTNAAAERWGE